MSCICATPSPLAAPPPQRAKRGGARIKYNRAQMQPTHSRVGEEDDDTREEQLRRSECQRVPPRLNAVRPRTLRAVSTFSYHLRSPK